MNRVLFHRVWRLADRLVPLVAIIIVVAGRRWS
jgi:hypothetical protein